MRYTLPGKPKLPPLKLINRINDSGSANEEAHFVFTVFLEGVRNKRSYRINNQEILAHAGNALGGGERLKNASYEEKIKSVALDITASTLFELRVSGYTDLADKIRMHKSKKGLL